MRRATTTTLEVPRIARPLPPRSLLESAAGLFVPAPEVSHWQRETLISEMSPLYNPEHLHLLSADVGVLWTNNELKVRGDVKAACALMPSQKGMGKLDKDLWSFMMRTFFRSEPDFLIVINAEQAHMCSDRSWARLNNHELAHCGQEKDGYGVPLFHKDSFLPKYRMRGHDHEFFTSDLRFGAREVLGAEAVDMILKSELEGPEVEEENISRMCGTCALAR
jgi:hypothetical protein